jgi:hypothetical protein
MIFELSRSVEDCAFVYVIGEQDGPVKIGFAKDPVKRLRTMQTGNPRRLRVEHVLIGWMELEKVLHQIWEPHAIVAASREGKVDVLPGTEWFKAEVRPKLDEVMITASLNQFDYLTFGPHDEEDGIDPDGLTHAVKQAHLANGVELKGRDEVLLLGSVGGYAVSRRSRI